MSGASSPEERAFAERVNAQIAGIGAKVWPFERARKDEAREWCLTIQHGTKRYTITSESPFHYNAVDDVVTWVRGWIARVGHASRWTTDLEAADGEAI